MELPKFLKQYKENMPLKTKLLKMKKRRTAISEDQKIKKLNRRQKKIIWMYTR